MGWHMRRYAQEDDYERTIPDTVLFRRMMGYILSQRRRSLMLLAAILGSTLINLLPPYMFSLAIDKYIENLDTQGLLLISGAFMVVYGLLFVAQYNQRFLINWLGSNLEYEIRMDVFRHLQELGLDFYATREVGSIVSRSTNDVDKITELISSGIANVVADFITLVGIVAIMLYMNWWLSLITFSVIPMMAVFLYFWGRRV
ncbi:hypothetical protein KAU18_02935, partial [Candidatus Bathyarchaeota archaeon]|nr:hypothetical protein [Candidatus Bathyarchaeota archaeon]